MFSLTSSHQYYLYKEATDMRKSFDGLCGIISTAMNANPQSGAVYLFLSKRKDRIKLLRWEGDGYVVYYKRLEAGTISLPSGNWSEQTKQLSWPELVMMIEGILTQNYTAKKRYKIPQPVMHQLLINNVQKTSF